MASLLPQHNSPSLNKMRRRLSAARLGIQQGFSAI